MISGCSLGTGGIMPKRSGKRNLTWMRKRPGPISQCRMLLKVHLWWLKSFGDLQFIKLDDVPNTMKMLKFTRCLKLTVHTLAYFIWITTTGPAKEVVPG
jgi:hypothetical protein